MTVATLAEVLQPALAGRHAVAGLVCQGWEDMCAYVAAAEAENSAVILQAGPGARAHTPLAILGRMMRKLAEDASVPVVVHLDHGESAETCRAAIGEGFTSVMFDGSRLSLSDNIAHTAAIAERAHAAGVSCEGEIGFVGYAAGVASPETLSTGTDPQEAVRFASETGVDAMAVSVGNLHLQESPGASLDEVRLRAIAATTSVPLVLHGASGIASADRRRLARTLRVCKFNVGTELRRTFGAALRQTLAEDPRLYDRIEILSRTEPPLTLAAREVIRGLKA